MLTFTNVLSCLLSQFIQTSDRVVPTSTPSHAQSPVSTRLTTSHCKNKTHGFKHNHTHSYVSQLNITCRGHTHHLPFRPSPSSHPRQFKFLVHSTPTSHHNQEKNAGYLNGYRARQPREPHALCKKRRSAVAEDTSAKKTHLRVYICSKRRHRDAVAERRNAANG